MIQNNLPLIHALIDAFLFLEHSGDDDVDPDSAVKTMESMTAALLKLTPNDQVELRSSFGRIADDAEDRRYHDFVRALPDMIGLSMGNHPH